MATTALLSEQKSILWRIPNFAEVCKSEQQLNEQLFKFEMSVGVTQGPAPPLRWKCSVRAKAKAKNGGSGTKDHVGLYISPENLPPELSASHARIRFQIEDKETGRYYFDGASNIRIQELLDKNMGRGFANVIPRFSKDTPFLATDGALEIIITVIVYHPQAQNAELAVLETEFKDYFERYLRYNLDHLRDDTLDITSRDTTIVSKDGEEIPVNRVILAARSPVFRAMFRSNLSEEQNGVVEVKDIDSGPLEVLLHFIHLGELTKDWRKDGIIEGLVYGAHKYMLDDLLKFLDKVMGLVCTKANCGKLMGLAKTFGLKKAEGKLFDYFKKNMVNNMDEVLKFSEETATAAALMTTQPEDKEEEESQYKKRKSE